MQILMTNNKLESPGGSETLIFALACQLKLMGHQVEIYSPHLGGLMLERFQSAGIPCINDLNHARRCDVIHLQHQIPALQVLSRFKHIPFIYTSLGVIPEEEHPPIPIVPLAKHFVAVSDEVKSMLATIHGVPEHKISVIGNGVNISRFRPINPLRKNPKIINILIHDRYEDRLASLIDLVVYCRKLPFRFTILGHQNPDLQAWFRKNKVPCRLLPITWQTENVINRHDLVIGLGRSALEGMACGKPVIVYRPGQADGIVTRRNFPLLLKNNFSGRFFRYNWTPRDLVKTIRWIFTGNRSVVLGRANRILAVQFGNIVEKANEYNSIYNEVVKSSIYVP